MTPSELDYRAERRFARRCVLQYLYQADQQDDWGNIERSLNLIRLRLPELTEVPASEASFTRGWQYAVRIIRGVCTQRKLLDQCLSECATNWTIERMSIIDRNILRSAAYELLYAADVPPATVIDEAIELAKEFGHRDSSRFVNGVLDRFLHNVPAWRNSLP